MFVFDASHVSQCQFTALRKKFVTRSSLQPPCDSSCCHYSALPSMTLSPLPTFSSAFFLIFHSTPHRSQPSVHPSTTSTLSVVGRFALLFLGSVMSFQPFEDIRYATFFLRQLKAASNIRASSFEYVIICTPPSFCGHKNSGVFVLIRPLSDYSCQWLDINCARMLS